jgi:hypothetical protein
MGFAVATVSFVSVTQSFNTTSSMGRLTLNVLLSFAQFEREVTGERIRDKIAAWLGTDARARPARVGDNTEQSRQCAPRTWRPRGWSQRTGAHCRRDLFRASGRNVLCGPQGAR